MADETGNKGLFDHVLDLFVYVPVGLMAESRDWLPRLADRGREQLDTQVRVARMLGQVAVQRGQQEAGKFFQRGRDSNGSAPAAPRPTTPRWSEAVPVEPGPEPFVAADEPSGTDAVASILAEVAPDVTDTSAPVEVVVVPEGIVGEEPDPTEIIPVAYLDEDPVTEESVGADELAIPAYDSLAASQVVQRLEGLTPAELESVRRYEGAHRGRKTILGKVAQLQQR